jgi:hypothetical protein
MWPRSKVKQVEVGLAAAAAPDNITNYSSALNFSVPHSEIFTVSIVHILALVVQLLVVHHRFMNIGTYELDKRLRMHTALRLVVQDKFN